MFAVEFGFSAVDIILRVSFTPGTSPRGLNEITWGKRPKGSLGSFIESLFCARYRAQC